jgi:hypothetical protein
MSVEAKNALPRLTRLAKRCPHQRALLSGALAHRLPRHAPIAVQVAVETGEPMGAILAELLERSSNSAFTIELGAEIPRETVELREVATIVARRRLDRERARGDGTDPATLAEDTGPSVAKPPDCPRKRDHLSRPTRSNPLHHGVGRVKACRRRRIPPMRPAAQ